MSEFESYYDLLEIAQTATPAEIEAAYAAKNNHWRHLSTHRDQTKVEESNRMTRLLQQARVTLLDPARRAQYDGQLTSGQVGGLVDPQAAAPVAGPPGTPYQGARPAVAPPGRMPTPPPPRAAPAQAGAGTAPVDGWVCTKCGATSPSGTRFCQQCGHGLGRDCPKCGKLLHMGAKFCPHCGTDVDATLREQERERHRQEAIRAQEERQRQKWARDQAELQARLEPTIRLADQAANLAKIGCIATFFVGILVAPLWIIAMIKARQALARPQIPGDAPYREKAKGAFTRSLIPTIIYGALLAMCVLLMVGSMLMSRNLAY